MALLLLFGRVLAADNLDAIQSSLVIESQRETLSMFRWVMGGCGAALALALAYIYKDNMASKNKNIEDVKAASAATAAAVREADDKSRTREHEATRAEIAKLANVVGELKEEFGDLKVVLKEALRK